MKNTRYAKKEIYFILYAFIFLALLSVLSKLYGFYKMHQMNEITVEMYEKSLKVSNSALNIKVNIYKMHRDMKDIVTLSLQKNLPLLVKEIDKSEHSINENLKNIQKNLSRKYALDLLKDTQKLFKESKFIRDEVISLVKDKRSAEALVIMRDRGERHILKLKDSVDRLYEYSRNEILYLNNEYNMKFDDLLDVSIVSVFFILLFFAIIMYYTINRISNYIYKNEHLKGVLSVIRDVNKLIVRENDKESLIRKSCDIMASKHVFKSAWIVLYDDSKQIEHIAVSDNESRQSILFKEKIENGWIPYCIKNINNDPYSFIENTQDNCKECPLKEMCGSKSVFTVDIKYNDKCFGFMTLSVNKKYIEYSDELSLIEEVAGDIAYALNNMGTKQTIFDLKELYDNTINSLENLLFVKDKNFTYIACNKAFEKFIGRSKEEIIGKNDYDILGKEFADFFREHDKIMFKDRIPKSNYEWVVYPDGKRVYLLTTKSPLLNSKSEIIGLVGSSIDVTKQKNFEDALVESEERFKLLMKESPSVIEVYDLDGFQIDVNHAYELLWGFPVSLTLNKFNLFKSKEVKKTGLLEYINRAYAGESVNVPIYEYDPTGDTEANGQGRVRILNTKIYPLKDSSGKVKNIVIMHEDVTDKENMLLELEQKRRELETIIKEAPNPMILHNEDGKIVMMNEAWSEASGYTLEEIPTIKSFIDKIYEKKKDRTAVMSHIRSLYDIRSRIDEGEYTFLNKNKKEVTWQFSSAPLGVIDSKRVIISSAMDITQLKQKDKMMMVQSRHAAMGEMIGMIAHQWRQPISIVSMIANNILLDSALGEFDKNKIEKYSNDILEQTEHLSKTVDDFRNFFKPDKSASKTDMKSVVEEVYSIVKESLKNNDIKLDISYMSHTKVYAYPRELMQVFVNIINNAKDVLVSDRLDEALIKISVYDDEEYVNTKICNNGGNIQKDIMSKIFDPYFTTKDEKTGTGLGLYMSKVIVEDHLHGIIEVSNIDNGVCFIVRLPKDKGIK